ncbi:NTP transferase domain-containing protein [Methanomicrobium antiquum]|uniref:UTP--glucose-1-phosphate uridylyltransferase n=1 Tax=Methanomicrobium antiquum TaxID=487686 RepID=A0AAF0FS10_9EURY|nr:sugar phosphate nucleotidyltransferase [Methanomicrobium antiquum]MDD3976572.1 sugar phosphate nucleotidyltransferase [Methanomicrobium sp.]WFN37517.1 NTP transferase domain-containing protein [Methanomicrobium antiquum]
MLVKQGLIPAAGSGTRLGPFTNAIPKELLPVGDKAVIEHVVCAMHLAGIEEIVIVTSPHKHGLSDYFGSGKKFGVDFTYVVQDERKGLGDAVLSGEHVIDGNFTVVLGDNYFSPKTFLKDLIDFHIEKKGETTVGVAEVEDVTRHGIITPDGFRVLDMVEKPPKEEAKSSLGALGAYVFSTGIFDAIKDTKPGYKGEIQLTDSIRLQIEQGRNVLYKKIDGIHIDVGTPRDLMRANEWYLSHDENGNCKK